MADGEPGGRQKTGRFLGVALRPLPTEDSKIPHSLSMDLIPSLSAVWGDSRAILIASVEHKERV